MKYIIPLVTSILLTSAVDAGAPVTPQVHLTEAEVADFYPYTKNTFDKGKLSFLKAHVSSLESAMLKEIEGLSDNTPLLETPIKTKLWVDVSAHFNVIRSIMSDIEQNHQNAKFSSIFMLLSQLQNLLLIRKEAARRTDQTKELKPCLSNCIDMFMDTAHWFKKHFPVLKALDNLDLSKYRKLDTIFGTLEGYFSRCIRKSNAFNAMMHINTIACNHLTEGLKLVKKEQDLDMTEFKTTEASEDPESLDVLKLHVQERIELIVALFEGVVKKWEQISNNMLIKKKKEEKKKKKEEEIRLANHEALCKETGYSSDTQSTKPTKTQKTKEKETKKAARKAAEQGANRLRPTASAKPQTSPLKPKAGDTTSSSDTEELVTEAVLCEAYESLTPRSDASSPPAACAKPQQTSPLKQASLPKPDSSAEIDEAATIQEDSYNEDTIDVQTLYEAYIQLQPRKEKKLDALKSELESPTPDFKNVCSLLNAAEFTVYGNKEVVTIMWKAKDGVKHITKHHMPHAQHQRAGMKNTWAKQLLTSLTETGVAL